MNEIQQLIVNHYESKSSNFKKRISREFKKSANIVENQAINKYKDIAIYNLFIELTNVNNPILSEVDDLLQTIEATLFTYLNSSDDEDLNTSASEQTK